LGKNPTTISNTLCNSIVSLLYVQTKNKQPHLLTPHQNFLVENDKPGKAAVEKEML